MEPGFDLLDIVTPAGIFTSFVASFFCFANIWADRRFLPRPLRAPVFLQVVNLAAGSAFLFTAVRAMASYQGVWGYGVHHCLGAPLARIEGQIAVLALLRLPELQLENRIPEWQEGLSLRTPKSLPVRFRAS